jgi:hypothetical protein
VRRGAHAADDRSFVRSAGAAVIRGIALIAVAVVLGVVLLQATDAPSPFEATTRDTTTTTATEPVPEPDDGTDPADPAPAEPRDPGTYTVLVANASGVSGVAARVTEQVQEAGFQAAAPSNAARAPTSTVYFNEGFEAEAQAVAALFTPVPEVAPLDLDPLPVDDLRGASVVVIVGPDLATAE